MTSNFRGRGRFFSQTTGGVEYLHDLNIFILSKFFLGLYFCDYTYQHGRLMSLI